MVEIFNESKVEFVAVAKESNRHFPARWRMVVVCENVGCFLLRLSLLLLFVVGVVALTI